MNEKRFVAGSHRIEYNAWLEWKVAQKRNLRCAYCEFTRQNGDVRLCFHRKERMGNVRRSIRFFPDLIRCDRERCGCPFYDYLRNLLDLAVDETNCGRKTEKTAYAKIA